jgi:hypothetical protein
VVGAHAHPDDHDTAADRGLGHDAVDHARYPDALEYHGAPRAGAAGTFREAVGVPPVGEPGQLRHAVETEVEHLGGLRQVAVFRRGREGRFLRGVDDVVGAHVGGQRATAGGEVAGDNGADPGGLEHADHG